MARATFKKGAKVERWERNLKRPIAALKAIGALGVAETKLAFREQGFPDERWPPRHVPNAYGIIRDFAGGSGAPRPHRFDDRPALKDTGNLSRSFSFVINGMTVSWGSDKDYAERLHKGGDIESEKITPTIQKSLGAWLKGAGKRWKPDLGFLLSKLFTNKRLKGKVQARVMTQITKTLIADVEEVVGVHIMEAK
jgi:hypothetical protein